MWPCPGKSSCQELFVRSWVPPGLCGPWKNRNIHSATSHNFLSEPSSEALWLSYSHGRPRPPHPHAFANFPPSGGGGSAKGGVPSAVCLSACWMPPPLVFPQWLWLKLGHPHPCGSSCLCPTLGMNPFSPGSAAPSFLWHRSTELS